MKFIKKAIPFICVATTLFCEAQDADRKHSIGLYQNFTDYNVQLLENDFFAFDSSLSHSTRIAYQQRLSRTWMLNAGVANGFILNQKIKKEFVTKAYALGLDISLLFKLNNGRIIKENPLIAPYFTFGYRSDYIPKLNELGKNPWLFHNQYGAGLNIRLSNRTHFQLQTAVDQKLNGDFNTHIQYRMGITQSLGKLEENSQKSKVISDTDKDGIADVVDKCPNLFGLKKLDGCPDTITNNSAQKHSDSLAYLLKTKLMELELMELELSSFKRTSLNTDSASISEAKLLEEIARIELIKYQEIAELKRALVNQTNNLQIRIDTVYITEKVYLERNTDSVDKEADLRLSKEKKALKDKLEKENLQKELYEKKTDAENTSIPADKNYYVITISSPNKATAEAWLQKMLKDFKDSKIIPQPNGYYRVGVYVGKDWAEGVKILEKVKQIGYDPAWLSVE